MFRLNLGISFVVLVLLFSMNARSFAQASTSTGDIQGIVLDATGSAIENANVVLINHSLSLGRQTKTQSDGRYTFPLLQPGSAYEVSIQADGFKREVFTNLSVRITENTVANAKLSLGEVSQNVEVSGDAETIETTSATLGGIVGARVITSLPLPTRNVLDILGTDAGVATAFDSPASTIIQGSNTVYVAGSRATANNYLLNGVDANNFEFQTLASGVVPIPSPDSLEEFRTQTSLYDATSGYSSGGNINLITRSGTDSYHGVVYDFLRNTIFNANDYFLNAKGQPRPTLIQNQFGASFGGPIPKLHETFFFVNYEGMRQKNGITGTTTGSVPVLPATITASTLAAAFNLSAAQIDPVAVNLLNEPGSYGGYLYPRGIGTVGSTVSYAYSHPVILNSDQVSSRIDHDFKIWGQANHLTGTGFVHNQLYTDPSGDGGQPYNYPLGSQHATISDTHIFRSNLFNEAVYGYNWDRRDIEATAGGVTLADVGMTRSNSSITDLLPNFSITNLLAPFGYAANVVHPQHAASFDFRDTLSWIKHEHTIRVGFENRREEFNDGIYVPRGSLTFNGGVLGTDTTPFQDFLGGAPSAITFLSGVSRLDFRAHDYIAFLQDDYHVLPRLTLNLGLRYDNLGNPYEIKNQITNFDPSLLSAATLQTGGAGLQAAFVTAGQNGVSRNTMLNTNYGSYSPRVGFAYDVLGNGKLVVRSGFGLYYETTGYALQLANSGNPPFQISTSNSTNTATKILANPFPALPLPNEFPIYPTFPTLTGVNSSGAPTYTGPALSVAAIDRHIRSPYTESWNLTVEGEVAPGWTLEVGYLGANGIRQTSNTQQNTPLLINSNSPGRFNLTTNTGKNRESRVPIAGLSSSGFSYLTNNANSSYNALIATLNHRFAKGFLVKAAYTYAKSIDNFDASSGTNYSGSALGNPYSLEENRGDSEQDIPNRLVFTYVWDLPGFRTGPLNYVLGHWALAGISTFQNGAAGVITNSSGTNSFDTAAGYGVLVPGCRLVASGRIEDHLTNYLSSTCASAQPLVTSGTVLSGLTPYQTPGSQSYTVGTAGGTLLGTSTRGAFFAPFQERTDLTLSKNFPVKALGEGGNIEFRAESFKIFNNAIFSAPASAVGSSTFGTITSTIDNTGRQFQFALKASF
jgi:Carboxypeptidase regulatory-like domain